MADKQKTIKEPITIKGRGLHTGVETTITFKPAPANHGIIFQRIDLKNKPVVEAIVDNVTETSRGTTIENNGAKVSTIEHVMSALSGMQIDNALIEVDGPEVPIIDGSAKDYVEGINKTGIVELEEDKEYYVIKEKVSFSDDENGVDIAVYPDNYLSIHVLIDYNSPVLGHQYASLNRWEEYAEQVAGCRTFVFLRDLEPLLKSNMIKGGDLDNAIIIIDKKATQEELDHLAELFNKPKVKVQPEGVLNNINLRFSNEPARHKLLDIIGDLALIGTPIKGKIVATKPGHHANTELAKKIRQLIKKDKLKADVPDIDLSSEPLCDINEIMRILPHRPPFLLVDKVFVRTKTTVIGIKNITMNEPFFVGHFPDEPILPAVLQVEAMAQVGGILVLNTVSDPENYATYFLRIDKARFKRKVVPGDTVIFKLDLLEPIRRGLAHMYGQAFVGDNVVSEAEMMAQIVRVKD